MPGGNLFVTFLLPPGIKALRNISGSNDQYTKKL